MAYSCNPSSMGHRGRRITVWDQLQAKVQDLSRKITKAKSYGGMAWVVECLPSNINTHIHITTTTTIKKNNTKWRTQALLPWSCHGRLGFCPSCIHFPIEYLVASINLMGPILSVSWISIFNVLMSKIYVTMLLNKFQTKENITTS
jgi:hypothetical protein